MLRLATDEDFNNRIVRGLLRRQPDGSWPAQPQMIDQGGEIALESIGFAVPLIEFYDDTHLARPNSI